MRFTLIVAWAVASLTVLPGCEDADTPGCHCAQPDSFDVDAGGNGVCAPRSDDGGRVSFPCSNYFERSPTGTYVRPTQYIVAGRNCTTNETQRGCENGSYRLTVLRR